MAETHKSGEPNLAQITPDTRGIKSGAKGKANTQPRGGDPSRNGDGLPLTIIEEGIEDGTPTDDRSVSSHGTSNTIVSHLWKGTISDDVKILAKSIMSKPPEERGNSEDYKSLNSKKDELSLLISLVVHTAYNHQPEPKPVGRLTLASAAMGL